MQKTKMQGVSFPHEIRLLEHKGKRGTQYKYFRVRVLPIVADILELQDHDKVEVTIRVLKRVGEKNK